VVPTPFYKKPKKAVQNPAELYVPPA
jgi:hypothetical protein